MSQGDIITASRIGLDLADLGAEQRWYLVEARDDSPADIASELQAALEGVDVPCVGVSPSDPRDLLAARADATCLVTGRPEWTTEQYRRLDGLRSRVREAWPRLVWIADRDGVRHMVHDAAHFFAFFEPAARWSDGSMSDAEVEEHLARLRELYGMTDEQVLEHARAGTLRQDADHQAWLILLGQDALVDKGT